MRWRLEWTTEDCIATHVATGVILHAWRSEWIAVQEAAGQSDEALGELIHELRDVLKTGQAIH